MQPAVPVTVHTKQVVKNKKWTGMAAADVYTLEKLCLLRLEETFKCICKHKKQTSHFPKLVGFNDKTRLMQMTHQGPSFRMWHEIEKKEKPQQKLPPPSNYKEQIDCILHNLERAHIRHFDMNANGNNLCLSEDRTCISLIDFDASCMDDFPQSEIIAEWHSSHSTFEEYKASFGEKMRQVVVEVAVRPASKKNNNKQQKLN